MKKLNEIINCKEDILIKNIQIDSRKVKKGDLFVAIKGYRIDHHLFIDDAIKNGAVAVVGEEDIKCDSIYIKVEDSNIALREILSKFYDEIEKDFTFIGITGTDGKTTSATITSKLLDCCYIGTNGVFYKGKTWSTNNTTPEICDMYKYLAKLKKLDCKVIVMEVSSEALLHKRVDNFKFDIAAFTNITEDHLNIHKTIENYVNSKKKLFSLINKNAYSILNIDDKNYDYIKKDCQENVYSYGKNEKADFKICQINITERETSFVIKHKDTSYPITTTLIGEYNIYNICLAFIIAYIEKIDPTTIIERIKEIKRIDGRGENLDFKQNYTIILDYAHTYNGIYNIITNLKKFNYQKIILVTGAAGGREVEKRRKIGKMILENVDLAIFTMDDPRCESVDSIIDQLIEDSKNNNYLRIIDRKEAIEKALSIAKKDDLILILGKGRDNYMAIQDKKIKYCDYDVINNYFHKL